MLPQLTIPKAEVLRTCSVAHRLLQRARSPSGIVNLRQPILGWPPRPLVLYRGENGRKFVATNKQIDGFEQNVAQFSESKSSPRIVLQFRRHRRRARTRSAGFQGRGVQSFRRTIGIGLGHLSPAGARTGQCHGVLLWCSTKRGAGFERRRGACCCGGYLQLVIIEHGRAASKVLIPSQVPVLSTVRVRSIGF